MESSFPKKRTPESISTIKKCIPVLDAITAGYIIVTPSDVYVTFEDGEPVFTVANAPEPLLEFHPRKQAYKHPAAQEFRFPKWINPWAIKTPKGYSCLFVPPMHNPNEHFETLEGIVDTDSYYARINLPFILKNKNEKEFMIPAGTPIVQIIPFKRESWESELSNDRESPAQIRLFLRSHFFDRYKRFYWHRKNYS
jgi:hypothetical protein